MAKKSFSTAAAEVLSHSRGIDTIIPEPAGEQSPAEAPIRAGKKSREVKEIRRTAFAFSPEELESLKRASYWDHKSQRAILSEALALWLSVREHARGPLEAVPAEEPNSAEAAARISAALAQALSGLRHVKPTT